MDDTDELPAGTTTRYFYWEGVPARMHREQDGDLSADAYHAGKGLVKVDPTDLYYGSYEISEARYRELVLQATGLGRRTEQA